MAESWEQAGARSGTPHRRACGICSSVEPPSLWGFSPGRWGIEGLGSSLDQGGGCGEGKALSTPAPLQAPQEGSSLVGAGGEGSEASPRTGRLSALGKRVAPGSCPCPAGSGPLCWETAP